MHIYYFILSGPMDRSRFDAMVARGIFTTEEADILMQQHPGSVPHVVYAWAIHIVKNSSTGAPGRSNGSNEVTASLDLVNDWASGLQESVLAGAVESSIAGVRSNASWQPWYTSCQTPYLYAQAVYVSVIVYISEKGCCHPPGRLYPRPCPGPPARTLTLAHPPASLPTYQPIVIT